MLSKPLTTKGILWAIPAAPFTIPPVYKNQPQTPHITLLNGVKG